MAAYAQCLVWTDLEATGLNFDEDEVLEVAFFISDFDLNPIPGTKLNRAIKITPEGEARVAANPYVLDMHTKSGLLEECRNTDYTRADAERDMLAIMKEKTTFNSKEFAYAGSGVARFDMSMYESQFPYVHDMMAYYPFDFGILRRVALKLNRGMDFIEPVKESFEDGKKTHRAWDDITAHFKEAHRYRDKFDKVRAMESQIRDLQDEVARLKRGR